MAVNKVILIGYVGNVPEIRNFTQNNNQQQNIVANFSVATTERYRDNQGNVQEKTEWHYIVAWSRLAEVAEKYINKGTQVYIEGTLRTVSWVDSDKVTRYSTQIVARNIQLLGRRESQQGSMNYQSANSKQQTVTTYPGPTQQVAQHNNQPSQPVQQTIINADNGVEDLPF